MLILDTHTIIWYLNNHPQLPRQVSTLLEIEENLLGVSIATYWEIAIKLNLKKLSLPIDLENFILLTREKKIHILPISEKAVLLTENLPLHHRDPFDRIIIAEAISQDVPIVSADKVFDLYDIERIW